MSNRHWVKIICFLLLSTMPRVESQPSPRPAYCVYLADTAHALQTGKALPQALDGLQVAMAPAFSRGHAWFPTSSNLLKGQSKLDVASDALAKFARGCHEGGLKVLAYFDLLQWTDPNAPAKVDFFGRRPELQELSLLESLIDPKSRNAASGKYLSLWNPEVRFGFQTMLADFAADCPDVDGIVLDCHLSYTDILGYSEAARVAYIKAASIDPIDLQLGSRDDNEERYAREWCWWREQEITRFVGELVSAYRSVRPQGKVFAMGLADYFRWPLGRRNYLLNNWLLWAKQGSIDGAFLEDDWTNKDNARLYEAMVELCKKEGAPIPLYPVIPVKADTTPGDIKAALEAIGGNPPPPMVVYRVDGEEALKRVGEILGKGGH